MASVVTLVGIPVSLSSSVMRTGFRQFGSSDLWVSPLGVGTAEMGFTRLDDRGVDAILGAACEAGINVLDTAAMYGDSEEKLGRLLAGRRDKFLIFTKCGRYVPELTGLRRPLRRLRQMVGRMVGEPPYEWLPATLQSNIEESLRRLRTNCIDLMQLHSCSEDILARGDAIRTLQKAKEAGKVRYIGYSGDGAAALWAIRSGLFDAIQLSVNIADQQPLENHVPQALAARLGVIAKRPIANAVWKSAELPHEERLRAYWHRLSSIRYDFISSPSSVATALKFTLQTGVHVAVVGTTSAQHMQSNIAAASDLSIGCAQYDAIRERWKQVATPEWVPQM